MHGPERQPSLDKPEPITKAVRRDSGLQDDNTVEFRRPASESARSESWNDNRTALIQKYLMNSTWATNSAKLSHRPVSLANISTLRNYTGPVTPHVYEIFDHRKIPDIHSDPCGNVLQMPTFCALPCGSRMILSNHRRSWLNGTHYFVVIPQSSTRQYGQAQTTWISYAVQSI